MFVFAKKYIVGLLLLCSSYSMAQLIHDKVLSLKDSLLLRHYRNEVIKLQASEEDSLDTVEVIEANWGNSNLDEGVISYAPDRTFKIITFIFESCGAYCNSEWYSWIHYNLKGKEQSEKATFNSIDTIYQLPDKRYLVIDQYGGRPASVLTVDCRDAVLLSFEGNSVVTHPIAYRKQENFGFCQENGADMEQEPYIRYDASKQLLKYHFANNYAYSNEVDIDTIRQGQFIYSKGYFILEKELIKVVNRQKLPAKTSTWTEQYKIRSTDTLNIHIARIKEQQLVYDCLGSKAAGSETINVSSISRAGKKKLLNLPLNGAYLEKIELLKLKGNYFIYVVTNETSGNSDGYLYYWNTQTMTAYPVAVEKSNPKLPKGCQTWGSYSYLAIDPQTKAITTTSQFIGTVDPNRRGSITTTYKLEKLKVNQFVIKGIKSVVE
jgi:hypothetical protein